MISQEKVKLDGGKERIMIRENHTSLWKLGEKEEEKKQFVWDDIIVIRADFTHL